MPYADPLKQKENARIYRLKNRAQVLEWARKSQCTYRKNHPEKIAAYKKANQEKNRVQERARRKNNPEKRRNQEAEYREKNRERLIEYNRVRRKNNPEKYRELARTSQARRRSTPEGKLLCNLRNRVWIAVARGLGAKSARTIELIGCTIPELRIHLEKQFRPGMTWENYGPVWHVDHRRPCVSFDLTKPEQQRECFHFSNLQPLFALENLQKHHKESSAN